MTADPPAAPGVTKEVRAALDAVIHTALRMHGAWSPSLTDAKSVLLAAIEKYGKQQREAGAEEERGDYPEQEHTPYD